MRLTFADGRVDDVIIDGDSVGAEQADGRAEVPVEGALLEIGGFDLGHGACADPGQREARVVSVRVAVLSHVHELHVRQTGVACDRICYIFIY